MSRYFLDTEFHEYHKQQKVCGIKIGKAIPTIDLISIGIVRAENNDEYYAICKDFNIEDAWNSFQIEKQTPFERDNGLPGRKVYWLRENVLKPIFLELMERERKEFKGNTFNDYFDIKSLAKLISKYGKSKKQIVKEIKGFIAYFDDDELSPQDAMHPNYKFNNPEFYAYYADYDWVVFAQLFGKMMDLPNGFPMYCIDLKQELDNKYLHQENKYKGMSRLDAWLQDVKGMEGYPKQEDNHNALDDAMWNLKLYKFLKQF